MYVVIKTSGCMCTKGISCDRLHLIKIHHSRHSSILAKVKLCDIYSQYKTQLIFYILSTGADY